MASARPPLHAVVLTTTGLDKREKDSVRAEVEAAGGRYSPNLSKRTTHLVTPEVVRSLTEKLAAAAAPARFPTLRVVNRCWVSASAAGRRAAEEQFAPLLPPGAADPFAAAASQRGSSGGSTPSVAAAAEQQTPWVVHFSQLPDDSVYPAPVSAHGSPSANQHLVQQLHLQLSPILEAQHSQPGGSPQTAAAAAGGYGGTGAGRVPGRGNAAGVNSSSTHGGVQRQQQQWLPAPAAAAASTPPHGQAVRPPLPPLLQQIQAALMPAAAAAEACQHATPSRRAVADAGSSWQHSTPRQSAPSGAACKPPLLQLPRTNSISCPGYENSHAAAAAAWQLHGSASNKKQHPHQQEQQQQQQHGALIERLLAAGGGVAQVTSHEPATVQPHAAPWHGVQQHQQQQHHHQQQQADAAVGGGGTSLGSVGELIAALQRATTDSRRSTADTVPASPAWAAAAGVAVAVADGEHRSSVAADASNGTGMEALLSALRRVTGGDAATQQQQQRHLADGGGDGSAARGAAAACAPVPPQQQLRPQGQPPLLGGAAGSSTSWPVTPPRPAAGGLQAQQSRSPAPLDLEQLLGRLHAGDAAAAAPLAMHTPARAQGGRAAVPPDAAAVAAVAALPLPLSQGDAAVSQQLACQQPAGNGSSVADLIAALRRATGDSRRNTAETTAAGEAAAYAADAADVAAGRGRGPADVQHGTPPCLHKLLAAGKLGQQQQPEHPQHLPWPAGGSSNSATGGSGGCQPMLEDDVSGEAAAAVGGVDSLLSALQCIAAASSLQHAGSASASAAPPATAPPPPAAAGGVPAAGPALSRSEGHGDLVRQLSGSLQHSLGGAAAGHTAEQASELPSASAAGAVRDLEGGGGSPQDLQQLIAALRRATGEQQQAAHVQQQQQPLADGGCSGNADSGWGSTSSGRNNIADLVAALRSTGVAGAAAAPAEAGPLSPALQQQQPQGSEQLPGQHGGAHEGSTDMQGLVAALQRATADSRRDTVEQQQQQQLASPAPTVAATPGAAQAVASTPEHAGSVARGNQHLSQLLQLLSVTATPTQPQREQQEGLGDQHTPTQYAQPCTAGAAAVGGQPASVPATPTGCSARGVAEAAQPHAAAATPGAHCNAASAGTAAPAPNCQQQQPLAGLAAAFDPAVPAPQAQQLAEALAFCGGRVVPGQPHLGCGANTIIAEPEAAVRWLPLLLDVVSPAWLAKACKQHQWGGLPQLPGGGLQLVRVSPDIARTWSVQLQQQQAATQAASLGGWRNAAAEADRAGERPGADRQQQQQQQAPPMRAAAAWSSRASPLGVHCATSSPCRGQGQQLQVPLLVVPEVALSAAAAGAGGGMHASHASEQQVLMPASLLTELSWSVNQDPRCVGEEELEAVVLQCASFTLLLPQDSSGVMGHAAISCCAGNAARGGFTCAELLHAMHGFYQQEVLLSCGPADDASEDGSRLVVVQRAALLGHRLGLEGLFRVTRNPHSSVYEVCLG